MQVSRSNSACVAFTQRQPAPSARAQDRVPARGITRSAAQAARPADDAATIRLAQAIAPATCARSIDKVALRDLPAKLDDIRGVKPVVIQIEPETWAGSYSTFVARQSPQGLVDSPMAHDPVLILSGATAEGASRRNEETTLHDLLQPLLQDGSSGQPEGAYAYLGFMINKDRTHRFLDSRAPRGLDPWHDYIMSVAPPWPREILRTPGMDERNKPVSANSSLVLSIGEGPGAAYHGHDANLFLQLHGRKLWSIFEPAVFKPFLHPTEPQPFGQIRLLDPALASALAQPGWALQNREDLPQPIQFISEPGQMVYIPPDWIHATWNCDAFTAAFIKHNDRY